MVERQDSCNGSETRCRDACLCSPTRDTGVAQAPCSVGLRSRRAGGERWGGGREKPAGGRCNRAALARRLRAWAGGPVLKSAAHPTVGRKTDSGCRNQWPPLASVHYSPAVYTPLTTTVGWYPIPRWSSGPLGVLWRVCVSECVRMWCGWCSTPLSTTVRWATKLAVALSATRLPAAACVCLRGWWGWGAC